MKDWLLINKIENTNYLKQQKNSLVKGRVFLLINIKYFVVILNCLGKRFLIVNENIKNQ